MSDLPIESLIAKYFARETSAEENQFLLHWVQENDEHQEIFNTYQEVWKNCLPDEQLIFNSSKAIDKIEKHLQEEKRIKRKAQFRIYMKIAASIVIILGLSSIFFFNHFQPTKTISKSTEYGQKMRITLPDGSLVNLNAGSTLSYPENFSNDERAVILEGEAFFQVMRNEEKPFIVKSQNLTTTVLGTSFNINAFDSISNSVAVVSGKVKVENSHQALILNPNQQTRNVNGTLKMEEVNAQNIVEWTQGVLRFEDSELKNVIKSLERWYGVNFILKNGELDHCKFTGQFQNEKLVNVLNVLQEALGITYEVKSKEIIITGKGC